MTESIPSESELARRKCKACEGGVAPLGEFEVEQGVRRLDGWAYEGGALTRTYSFKNFYQTMAFVNALAWISHVEDHHPTMEVGYKTCAVRYRTHAINGISQNDFICAAKANRLLAG